MAFKNYKELCNALSLKPLSGNSKIAQLKWIEQHIELEKKGYGFVVKKILNTNIQPVPTRGGANNNIDCPNFLVHEDYWKSKGVYKIYLNNDIYIGSTTQGFRSRFLHHNYDYSLSLAKEILKQGATFEIIEVCENMSEPEIRELESKWIEHYKENGNYNVLNEREVYSFTQPQNMIRHNYKMILIETSKYEEVEKLLDKHNIKHKRGGNYKNKSNR